VCDHVGAARGSFGASGGVSLNGIPLKRLVMVLAATGLTASVIVHVSALLGMPSPLGDKSWVLHIGIFVVWLPAVLVLQPLTREFKQKDLWRAALRGCPKWMRRATWGFCGYAVVNFLVFAVSIRGSSPRGGPIPDSVWRGFSGHWMAFYSMAFAIMYSAIHVEQRDPQRRCVGGHPVSSAAQYCEQCGKPVIEVPTRGMSGGKRAT
jgi:hypothetical protein